MRLCTGVVPTTSTSFTLPHATSLCRQGTINAEEFNFFSFGAGMVDRTQQRANNADWLPPAVWDNITEMDKIAGFQGITSSFEQMQREWKVWYMSGKPEIEPMPADWSIKTSELQKLCLLRALRVDRVLFGATRFVAANIGPEYVDPPAFDLKVTSPH